MKYRVVFEVEKPDPVQAVQWAEWVAGYESIATPVEIVSVVNEAGELVDLDLRRGQ